MLLLAAGLTLAMSSAAGALSLPPVTLNGTVQLDQAAYTAHENQGYLTITIVRSGNVLQTEHVGYGVKDQDARDGIDFHSVSNTYITMPIGELTYSFKVPIIDQGMNGTPVHAKAYLYGSSPDTIGANNNAVITILHDDPIPPRDDANPLGVPGPVNGNLIAGAHLFVDPDSPSAQAQRSYEKSNPGWARLLGDIASEPGAHRFYMWNMGSTVEGQVAHYLETTQVQEPGTTVLLSTYNLVHDGCGYTATIPMEEMYENFINELAGGIGNFHVIFFLELDSLITTPCLNHTQLAIREAELRYAVSKLTALPHTVVYLDGGAADAINYRREAQLLRASGLSQAQGFFLNSTHYDWMTSELHYGEQISKLDGGAHFIINSGESGKGPLRPKNRSKNGNEVLCNPPGRGLGPLTVSNGVATQTRYPNADGFLWFDNPGGSGGQCVPGAPPTAHFWPAYAVMLAKNWVHRVTGPKPATDAPKKHTHKRKQH